MEGKTSVLILCIILSLNVFGSALEVKALQRQVPSRTVKLDKNKPSIFITFEHQGERAPLKDGESRQGVWLRLHNNTRWVINFDGFETPNRAYGDVGIFDEIVVMSAESLPMVMPGGYGPPHVSSTVRLEPGKSVLFSLPKEHLSENYAIRIEFSYGWEDGNDVFAGREPKHYVYFLSSWLPPASHKIDR